MSGLYDFESDSSEDQSAAAAPPRSPSPSLSDDLHLLPEAKRRKLIKLRGSRPTLQKITLSEGAAAVSSGSDCEGAHTVAKPPDVLEVQSSPTRVQHTAPTIDKELQALLQQNQALRDRLQASAEDAVDASQDLHEPEPHNDQPGDREPAGSPPGSPAVQPDKLTLTLKTRQQCVKLRIARNEAFGKLFARFREHAATEGWIALDATVRFLFDGERVSEADTPGMLDMDDGDTLDVAT